MSAGLGSIFEALPRPTWIDSFSGEHFGNLGAGMGGFAPQREIDTQFAYPDSDSIETK